MSFAYRPEVDGLRAIAVGSVIIFHVWPQYLAGGFLGVDVFLVISGYLITKIVYEQRIEGRFTFKNFYMRRIRRILPAQLLVILLCLAIFPFLLLPSEVSALGKSSFYSAFSAANIYFWLESGYFGALSEHSVLLHMWSLGVEEQFYMVWPMLLSLLVLARRKSILIVGTIALLGLSLFSAQFYVSRFPSAVFYLFPFRAFEFLLGGLLSFNLLPKPYRLAGEFISLVGMVVLGASVFLFQEGWAHPGLLTLIPCLAAAAIIYGTQSSTLVKATLANSPMVHLGLLSYSLYLVHWPVIVGVRIINGEHISVPTGLALIALVYAASLLLHYFWERPLRYSKFGKITLPSTAIMTLATFCAAIFFSAHVWANSIVTSGFGDMGEGDEFFNDVELVEAPVAAGERPACPYRLTEPGAVSLDFKSASECSADILILGDSHTGFVGNTMRALFGKDADDQKTITVSSWAGCPAILGGWKVYGTARLAAREKGCRSLIEHWEKDIAGSDASVVVLATRWSWLTEPGDYGPITIREDHLVTSESEELSHERSREVLKAGVRQLIDVAEASGKKVIIFGQPAVLTPDAERCTQNTLKEAGKDKLDANCVVREASLNHALSSTEIISRS